MKARYVLIPLGALLLVSAMVVGVYALVYGTAETRGRIALHNQQRSATELQASYEYFHDTCRDLIAKGEQIASLQIEYKQAVAARPATDPAGQYAQSLLQLAGQANGIFNLRASEAGDYNAKAHEFTHNFMQSKDLPLEIGPPDGVPFSALRCENQGGS